jgi:hypothetical protein
LPNPNGNPMWKKGGPSPNPSGRPKEDDELKRIIDEKCPPAYFVQKLLSFVDESENPKVRLAALVVLLERRYGKPSQAIVADVTGKVTLEQLIAAASSMTTTTEAKS